LQPLSDLLLAWQYAPVHCQDAVSSDSQADYVTRIGNDGNWTATDDWDNLKNGALSAWAHYWVVESCAHWFSLYGFYHPRDWHDSDQGTYWACDVNEHGNDFEGLLAFVRKGSSGYGHLQGIVTVFHDDFCSYRSHLARALTAQRISMA
jgi:hypothetical protein